MKEAKIKYQDQDYHLEIVVGEARVIDGYKRQIMLANTAENSPPPIGGATQDAAMYILKAFTYPNIVAGTRSVTNLDDAGSKLPEDIDDLTFEELLELPERLIRIWEDAILELNPHWMPNVELASREDDVEVSVEKKGGKTSSRKKS